MKKICELLVLLMIVFTFIEVSSKAEPINTNDTTKSVKVAVVVYDINGLYVSEVIKSLKDIQKQNEGKVEFTFFSSNENQSIQNQIIYKILQNKEFKLLLVELVDLKNPEQVINRVKEYNIPIVLFSREPINKLPIQSYQRAIFVGTNLEQAGIFEGEILADEWNNNKSTIDKDKDDILQYVMLKGPEDNLESIARAKYSVLTLNKSGIKTEELISQNSDWNNREEAKKLMEKFFIKYGDKIEAIITTNDTMALGAIDALQNIGYNKGNKLKTIPIVGVDAVPEAREFIKKGYMTGSVLQDAHEMAEAIYHIGMNLVERKNPLEGTKYEFDLSRVTVRIPYPGYITNK